MELINKESNPGFSVIIPVYNGEKTLADTLRSVLQMDFDEFEVIVVDDGSTDGTESIAREHGCRVVPMERNSGPATARNTGALHAKYDCLLFTDSDVWVPKNLLRELAARFETTRADAVQGTFSDVCPFPNYFSQYKNLYNRHALNHLPEWIDTTFTSITAVKRAAFHQCGGFDGNIRGASVEDRTLGRNLINNGFRIYLDKSLAVVHNKRLTFWGFLRNQYLRSRDLAKLMLRNRQEKKIEPPKENTKVETGHFGTNAPSTMIRIPVAYMTLVCIGLGFIHPSFWLAAALLLALFLYLIIPFEFYLLRQRGFTFALKGIAANFIDALASGLGVGVGIVGSIVFGKKY